MAGTINKGRNFEIRNITLNANTDTPVDFNSRFISNCTIQCRTAVDLYLRKSENSSDYFTIKSGTVFNLDQSMIDISQGGYVICYLRSASATPVAEVVGYFE